MLLFCNLLGQPNVYSQFNFNFCKIFFQLQNNLCGKKLTVYTHTTVLQLAEQVRARQEKMQSESGKSGMKIVLNATSEFCRALGDIPTYGQAGNREEDKDELMVGIFFLCTFIYLLSYPCKQSLC